MYYLVLSVNTSHQIKDVVDECMLLFGCSRFLTLLTNAKLNCWLSEIIYVDYLVLWQKMKDLQSCSRAAT